MVYTTETMSQMSFIRDKRPRYLSPNSGGKKKNYQLMKSDIIEKKMDRYILQGSV